MAQSLSGKTVAILATDGVELVELNEPMKALKDAGAEIVLASPKGGQPPLDPKSDDAGAQTEDTRRFKADAEAQAALAATVYVCRPPLETPTGKYLGMIHIQRLLREPPHESIGRYLDKAIDPLRPDAPLGHVTRTLATYNLVVLPMVDSDGLLLGAVSVDDLLDEILPRDWRENEPDEDTADTVVHTHRVGGR